MIKPQQPFRLYQNIKSFEVGQAENLHFSNKIHIHTLYLKSLKTLKKLPWWGIEPRSDDWQAKKGPLSQLSTIETLLVVFTSHNVRWKMFWNRGSGDDFPSRRLTISTSCHHDDSPFRRLTITTNHHFDDLPLRRITISTTFHYDETFLTRSPLHREFSVTFLGMIIMGWWAFFCPSSWLTQYKCTDFLNFACCNSCLHRFIDLKLAETIQTSSSTLCKNFIKKYVNLNFWWRQCKPRIG